MGLGWIDDAAFALGTELSVDRVLREGVRTTVARCWVDGPTAASRGARTVVAKCFRSRAMARNSGGFGLVREWAGLRCVPGSPALLAADPELGVVVMEDLGTAPTLADLLAGPDPDAALEGGYVWGRDTAVWLTASRRVVDDFQGLVRRADPGTRSAGGPASPRLPRRGAVRLAEVLGVESGVEEEVAQEVDRLDALAGVEGRRVVSQADPAPDNLVMTGPGEGSEVVVRALDLEAASYHHIAVDLAGLVSPWPASGLLARMPDEFQAAVMTGFGTGLEGLVDLLDDPAMDRMVGLAVLSAALQMTELTLEPLRRREDEGRFSGGRARLVSLWRRCGEQAVDAPVLAGLCARAAERAVRDWGWPAQLPFYPCFSDASRP
ncbi:MAG: aminoglycoside phosphotransferase family protein [Acidipropionibacterium acidipropionici]|jgi:hypothetical protein|uniref:Aminoglycoside phosphotransferase domain-containing protein n=2 Tax=Acidipropionibacterium acidipropionici TaxID=1748 RepID=A0AAC9AMQ0_9ACTN|nr:hypothetical protein [Acidipropionibacterium acidipropionici]AFV89249.1 hypothetical protein PACID_14320 [Acidipropionibacterium acidipropionici ATCC 4875]AMS04256.1 hypothetical protein AXH35_00875 [Acidipropionibacterium acidipropionici]AOZ45748.1 hypothetical protein A8L58_02345 [Acidipropionibacterium acidipropionici]AZP38246.1 aminoglycoside phosphotransferase family protein [Acidipropionibacterium acidipropionici]QCV95232.1 aminoglycoside phosphotransferase family protein [Acidipropio